MLAPELVNILVPAFLPCTGLEAECSQAKWDPKNGHIPRGFTGAEASLNDIQVILVTAEPGDPHPKEFYPENEKPQQLMEKTSRYTYECLESNKDLFHRNVRYFINLIYPTMPFYEQMRRVWITDAYLAQQ